MPAMVKTKKDLVHESDRADAADIPLYPGRLFDIHEILSNYGARVLSHPLV